ncbi:MAG: acyl-CoA reductase [Bacteroidales bacterium]
MIDALALTGAYLEQHALAPPPAGTIPEQLNNQFYRPFEDVICSEYTHNGWFTEKFVRKALGALAHMLKREGLQEWMRRYPALPADPERRKTVGVVMAGNIPLVGFHDMLSVIMSGNNFIGKPSSKDDRLLRMVADIICSIEPGFSDRISFTDAYLKGVDAIIATGSDNSARYFEYYFRNIPHIIRKNRNSIAVLSGNETEEELIALGDDIFSYFGLGCRNVTKIFIPEAYDLRIILKAFESFTDLQDHHKYNNNLEYNRSVYLLNRIPFLDNGIVLLKEHESISSPVGVVYYEYYSQRENVIRKITAQQEQIQCIVSNLVEIENSIPPGTSQAPALWDYADGVDTMEFLTAVTTDNGI